MKRILNISFTKNLFQFPNLTSFLLIYFYPLFSVCNVTSITLFLWYKQTRHHTTYITISEPLCLDTETFIWTKLSCVCSGQVGFPQLCQSPEPLCICSPSSAVLKGFIFSFIYLALSIIQSQILILKVLPSYIVLNYNFTSSHTHIGGRIV